MVLKEAARPMSAVLHNKKSLISSIKVVNQPAQPQGCDGSIKLFEGFDSGSE
jgi:hypothetical protein